MPGTLPRIAYSPPRTTFQYLTRCRPGADCNVLRCHEPRGAMSCGSPMPRGERIAKPAEWATRSGGFASWHRDAFDLTTCPDPANLEPEGNDGRNADLQPFATAALCRSPPRCRRVRWVRSTAYNGNFASQYGYCRGGRRPRRL